MQTYILLFRAINVGGNNLLPMKELKALLTAQGYQQVQTYIQSGNLVLQASKQPAQGIQQLVNNEFGFTPDILLLTPQQLTDAIENNPYPQAEGKTIHFYFCQQPPDFDDEKALSLKKDSEAYTLVDRVMYLHAPEGIGRSKLAAKMEHCLGVSATARNLNTVLKLQAMVNSD